MGGTLGQALVLVINTVGSIFLLALLLRFLLQAARADFYNPVTQAIVKLTGPLVHPLRRVIPGYRGFDFSTLLLALAVNSLATVLIIVASPSLQLPGISIIISWAFVGLLGFVINIYFWSLIVSVIASFIAPFSAHPALLLVHQLLEPLYRPVRRIIPPMGGLDLSPIFLFLGIRLLEVLVISPLAYQLRMNDLVRSIVIGV